MKSRDVFINIDLKLGDAVYTEAKVTAHIQDYHNNPNPIEVFEYIVTTLPNHGILDPRQRHEILSCTAGLPWRLKGWSENQRKTVIEFEPENQRVVGVTQYPLTQAKYKAEKRRQKKKFSL